MYFVQHSYLHTLQHFSVQLVLTTSIKNIKKEIFENEFCGIFIFIVSFTHQLFETNSNYYLL